MQPGVRASDAFQGVLFLTFPVDTASAFLAKEPLGHLFA